MATGQLLKQLAHDFHSQLKSKGVPITRAQVYELIAAKEGYRSYAAMKKAGPSVGSLLAKRVDQLELTPYRDVIVEVLESLV